MTSKAKTDILTISEAGELLGVHPNTLRKWDNSGYLKALRYGSRKDRRYKRSDLLQMLKKR